MVVEEIRIHACELLSGLVLELGQEFMQGGLPCADLHLKPRLAFADLGLKRDAVSAHLVDIEGDSLRGNAQVVHDVIPGPSEVSLHLLTFGIDHDTNLDFELLQFVTQFLYMHGHVMCRGCRGRCAMPNGCRGARAT